MYLGIISSSAGAELLINSFHVAGLLNSKLIIAGSGVDKENCISFASSLGNLKVEFLDVTLEKVAEIQSLADILLLPLKKGMSKTATPSKLIAYLFSSKPDLACVEEEREAKTFSWEDLNHYSCGWWTDTITSLIASALREAVSMTAEDLDKMGEEGKKLISLKYTWPKLAQKTLRLYDWLLGSDDKPDFVQLD